MAYQPIEDYGLIGDMRTVALVGRNGSIDWFCYPNFDSPSVFGALLDDRRGGWFRVAPLCEVSSIKQFYWPETNVLVTRFLSHDGVAELIDFMTIPGRGSADGQALYRMIRQVRGRMRFRLDVNPAFNYGRDPHTVQLCQTGARFLSSQLHMRLSCCMEISEEDGACRGEFTLSAGDSQTVVLDEFRDSGEVACSAPNPEEAQELFQDTVDYWRRWLSQSTYSGRWREMVQRSALILKLLTYEPTGAIVAAPTCSLPESIGGERNWDYRYTWIRDAAFTLYGFLRIGFTEEAASFMRWVEARCHELRPDGSLQIMYGINGEHELPEEHLQHLRGYRESRPVRIGNSAHDQLQLDIYGELMDSVYLYNKYGSPISYELWMHLRELLNWVCANWQRADEGIWEVRGGRKHFVYSKLMCWVALDRGLRLADKRSFPCNRRKWLRTRDAIYEQIMSRGWSEDRQAFVQHYHGDQLDAASLIMPLVFFVSPTDPRMTRTLDATLKPPEKRGLVSDSLVRRYDISQSPDGVSGTEGTFNMCSFWMVEALTRAGRVDRGRLDQARLMFERMLGYANHLGLYAEETGPCGEALGNYPQAFTHLALISAAYNLDRALDGR